MALEVRQRAKYLEDDWWEWSVWLEGTSAELDHVAFVVWHLHPTFPKPKVTRKDRSNGFRMDGSGWGEFTILAECHAVDGSDPTLLSHDLRLEYPRGERAPTRGVAPPPLPTVFLANSMSDAPLAKALREALRRHRITVVGTDDLDPGLPAEAALEASMKGSDAAVALTSGSTGSSWLRNEVGAARRLGVPIVPVVAGGFSLPAPLSEYQAIRLESAEDVGRVAAELADILTRGARAPRR